MPTVQYYKDIRTAQAPEVESLVNDGLSANQICSRLNLGKTTFEKIVSENGINYGHAQIGRKSQKQEYLSQIIELNSQGKSISQISRDLDISLTNVHRWLKEEDIVQPPKNEINRVCTRCRRELPLSEFPKRADRVDKLHAMCFRCRVDWAHDYRHDNPESIREASRRRRARIKGNRIEKYSDWDIFLRDKGKCFFCGLSIDIDLAYPDPGSLAINHIHPISKGGPDIAKNVAAAHKSCNQKAKDAYTPPFKSWVVAPIPYNVAKEIVVRSHYLHRTPNISYAYGAFNEDGEVVGVVTFGSPSSNRISLSVCDDPKQVIELNRLWIDDAAPFGLGSWMISKALKQLPAAIVVSYADTAIKDGRDPSLSHDGAIYRACSFRYGGTSRPNSEWQVPGKSRNVGKGHPGAVKVEVTPKRRFWTVTGTKSEKRHLRGMVKWLDIVL